MVLGDSGGYVEAVSVIHGAQPRLTSEARRWCTSIISWMGRNLGPRSVGVGSRVEQSAYLSLFRDVRKRMWCKRSSFRVGARFKSSTTLKKGHPYTPCRVTQAEGERERGSFVHSFSLLLLVETLLLYWFSSSRASPPRPVIILINTFEANAYQPSWLQSLDISLPGSRYLSWKWLRVIRLIVIISRITKERRGRLR